MGISHSRFHIQRDRGAMMARRPATPMSSVELMCNDFKKRSTRADRTLRFYREELRTVISVLEKGGCNTMPWEITEEDVVWLLDYYQKNGYTVQTRRGYISALRTWTKYYDNAVLVHMRIRWPHDMRPNADWLTYDQAVALMGVTKNPVQDLIIHCELCLGMRRIEVLRLQVDSFNGSYVDILGKGSMGGKPRRMPYHRDTAMVLTRYMRYRENLVSLAIARKPTAEIPNDLLIWTRGSKVSTYSLKGSGVDAEIKPLGIAIGYPSMSNHTLRRTFGRTMYRSGVPPATISKMLGHESLDQTLKYIGVDLDDMTLAMENFKL